MNSADYINLQSILGPANQAVSDTQTFLAQLRAGQAQPPVVPTQSYPPQMLPPAGYDPNLAATLQGFQSYIYQFSQQLTQATQLNTILLTALLGAHGAGFNFQGLGLPQDQLSTLMDLLGGNNNQTGQNNDTGGSGFLQDLQDQLANLDPGSQEAIDLQNRIDRLSKTNYSDEKMAALDTIETSISNQLDSEDDTSGSDSEYSKNDVLDNIHNDLDAGTYTAKDLSSVLIDKIKDPSTPAAERTVLLDVYGDLNEENPSTIGLRSLLNPSVIKALPASDRATLAIRLGDLGLVKPDGKDNVALSDFLHKGLSATSSTIKKFSQATVKEMVAKYLNGTADAVQTPKLISFLKDEGFIFKTVDGKEVIDTAQTQPFDVNPNSDAKKTAKNTIDTSVTAGTNGVYHANDVVAKVKADLSNNLYTKDDLAKALADEIEDPNTPHSKRMVLMDTYCQLNKDSVISLEPLIGATPGETYTTLFRNLSAADVTELSNRLGAMGFKKSDGTDNKELLKFEDVKNVGWSPFSRSILKAMVDKYLDGTRDTVQSPRLITFLKAQGFKFKTVSGKEVIDTSKPQPFPFTTPTR